VPNGSTANGVKLQIWTCTAGNTNQIFKVHAGLSQIEWNGKGKCLDLTNGNSTSGNPVRFLVPPYVASADPFSVFRSSCGIAPYQTTTPTKIGSVRASDLMVPI
jgi:hypothetical protein